MITRLDDMFYGDPVAPGQVIVEGQRLMTTARSKKIPYGLVGDKLIYRKTHGIVIEQKNLSKLTEAIKEKCKRKLNESK
jgi:hypothetical protein